MKCQCQIAKICWQDHVRNTDVSSLTVLGPVLDPIVRRRSSLFGHVARLPEDTPAHQALRCQIDLSLGLLLDLSWGRCPGRTQNTDNGTLVTFGGEPSRVHSRKCAPYTCTALCKCSPLETVAPHCPSILTS